MTNREKFFLNGLLLTAVGLAVRSVTLLFNSMISGKIGAEGIGLFTLIGTVYGFAVTFATSGISLTVTKLVSEAVGEGREREVPAILKSAVFYSLIFSTLATVVLLFGADCFGGILLSDKRTVTPLRILSLSLIPVALSSALSGYFIGVKRVAMNASVQIAAQVFKIAITAVFLFSYAFLGIEEGVTLLCMSITLTEISVFLVALVEFLIDKRIHFKNKPDIKKGHLGAVSKMALPLALSAYIRSALLTLEHILIPKRLCAGGESHEDALAHYGILHGMALPILLYPMSTLTSFSGLLVPEFSESSARGEGKRLSRVASEALNTTLVYSFASMAFVSLFSAELGYVFYGSYEAGKYISLMAPVIPIMYLDHVCDSMLKGIGEQVYSMWVNISDSLLSIILVWFLIPKLGISGYGLVIVIMEGYNFLLSVARLRKRIKFRIDYIFSGILPVGCAAVSAFISKKAFVSAGKFTSPFWLALEIIFAVCIFLSLYMFSKMLLLRKKQA